MRIGPKRSGYPSLDSVLPTMAERLAHFYAAIFAVAAVAILAVMIAIRPPAREAVMMVLSSALLLAVPLTVALVIRGRRKHRLRERAEFLAALEAEVTAPGQGLPPG